MFVTFHYRIFILRVGPSYIWIYKQWVLLFSAPSWTHCLKIVGLVILGTRGGNFIFTNKIYKSNSPQMKKSIWRKSILFYQRTNRCWQVIQCTMFCLRLDKSYFFLNIQALLSLARSCKALDIVDLILLHYSPSPMLKGNI